MLQLSTRSLSAVRNLFFLPDGRLLAHAERGMGIWNLLTGTREVFPIHYPWTILPTPQGDQYIVSRYNQGPQIRSFSAPQVTAIELIPKVPLTSARFTPDGKHLIGWITWNSPAWQWWRTDTWEAVDAPTKSPAEYHGYDTWMHHESFEISPEEGRVDLFWRGQ
jgi:hypothetical protein